MARVLENAAVSPAHGPAAALTLDPLRPGGGTGPFLPAKQVAVEPIPQ